MVLDIGSGSAIVHKASIGFVVYSIPSLAG